MNKIVALAMCSFFVVSASSLAAEPKWQGESYFLHTRGMPVSTLLKDFGANYHVPVVVSTRVNDIFVGQIVNENPNITIKRLEQLYDLVTFYDGGVFHIYKANEIKNEVVTSQYLQPDMLRDYLTKSGISFSKSCMLRQVHNYQAFEVQGVPACVERVTQLAREVDNKAKIKATTTEAVRVFPLKFASAADQNYEYRKQNVTVPGIVSILKSMKSGNSLPLGDGKDASPNEIAGTEFSADTNHNSVIIRAREVDMPIYEALIKQLDKRQKQIEISVAIIDVDAGNLRALGIDWSGTVGAGGFGVSFNTATASSGNYMSSVVSNSSDFMAKVSALQQNSQAQILSQPSVITQDNVQAILDKNVTFYTKLVGKDVAKLESVTSGTLMRVTPRLIERSDTNANDEVMLQLNIQDGQQSGVTSSNEPLPQVQNSEITTQATLKSGESLLLGGFVQDKKIVSKSGAPVLSDIPFLGSLFSTTSTENHRVVRLFLIKASPVSM